MNAVLYGYKTTDVMEPITVWEWKNSVHYGALEASLYRCESTGNQFYICPPYECAYGYQFFPDKETAENSRRLAVLERMNNIKKERAQLALELRRLKEETYSWKD